MALESLRFSQLRYRDLSAIPSSPPRLDYDPDWLEPKDPGPQATPPPTPPPPPFERATCRKRMLDAQKRGLYALLYTLNSIDREDPLRGSIARMKLVGEETNKEALAVLGSIHPHNVRALIKGCPDAFDTSELPSQVIPDATTKDQRPTIYVQYIADSTNTLPTPNQWIRVINTIQHDYLYGYGVDTTTLLSTRKLRTIQIIDHKVPVQQYRGRPSGKKYNVDEIKAGKRRYIQNAWQHKALQNFCELMREEAEAAVYKDNPMKWTVFEVGWASHPRDRMQHHREHIQSVNMMNLLDVCFQLHFRNSHRIQFRVFYEVPWQSAVSVAEHIISRLASAYTSMGGFNDYQAGISVETSKEVPSGTYAKLAAKIAPVLDERLAAEVEAFNAIRERKRVLAGRFNHLGHIHQATAKDAMLRKRTAGLQDDRRKYTEQSFQLLKDSRDSAIAAEAAWRNMSILMDKVKDAELVSKVQRLLNMNDSESDDDDLGSMPFRQGLSMPASTEKQPASSPEFLPDRLDELVSVNIAQQMPDGTMGPATKAFRSRRYLEQLGFFDTSDIEEASVVGDQNAMEGIMSEASMVEEEEGGDDDEMDSEVEDDNEDMGEDLSMQDDDEDDSE